VDPGAVVPSLLVPGSSYGAARPRRAGCAALLVGVLALSGAAQADQLPEAKRVPIQLAPNGLPFAVQGFAPRTPDIVPHESGCGMLEARSPDGREAVIVFDPGSDEAWGGVLLYIISGPDAEVLEWGGDPDPAACRAAPSGPTPGA
jgi:hypothetical protein